MVHPIIGLRHEKRGAFSKTKYLLNKEQGTLINERRFARSTGHIRCHSPGSPLLKSVFLVRCSNRPLNSFVSFVVKITHEKHEKGG